ncbi:unnamed protein product [Caenorhabditis bovis]|uniref:Uncharacterized protein n=1 Tax=Caenorhabditis bovis TaxID=2654633 RepID=A0A8S1EFY5_9PELO|nr:unnamed protein product [Caenorhabditis bovis]
MLISEEFACSVCGSLYQGSCLGSSLCATAEQVGIKYLLGPLLNLGFGDANTCSTSFACPLGTTSSVKELFTGLIVPGPPLVVATCSEVGPKAGIWYLGVPPLNTPIEIVGTSCNESPMEAAPNDLRDACEEFWFLNYKRIILFIRVYSMHEKRYDEQSVKDYKEIDTLLASIFSYYARCKAKDMLEEGESSEEYDSDECNHKDGCCLYVPDEESDEESDGYYDKESEEELVNESKEEGDVFAEKPVRVEIVMNM